MDAESFFARWSRRKDQTDLIGRTAPPATGAGDTTDDPAGNQPSEQTPGEAHGTPEQAGPPPTLEDVARLMPESDYARFMAPGVDDAVKRSALKKLFSDPHYNVMDGLDTYIEDYNTFVPIPAAMLAKLKHARALLDPLANLSRPASGLATPPADSVAAPESIDAVEALDSNEGGAEPGLAADPAADRAAAPEPETDAPCAIPHAEAVPHGDTTPDPAGQPRGKPDTEPPPPAPRS